MSWSEQEALERAPQRAEAMEKAAEAMQAGFGGKDAGYIILGYDGAFVSKRSVAAPSRLIGILTEITAMEFVEATRDDVDPVAAAMVVIQLLCREIKKRREERREQAREAESLAAKVEQAVKAMIDDLNGQIGEGDKGAQGDA